MTNPISFKSLSKSFSYGLFKKHRALNGVSLDVREGEVFGFLGPNGAGKSTSINIALGFIKPDSGNVFIQGIPASLPESRRYVGYLPEHPNLYDQLTAAELLTFCGSATRIPRRAIREKTDGLLDRLGLLAFKKRPVRTYSKGMKQRLGLAMAMIGDPPLLILDEPMSGLDPMGRSLVTEIILELKASGKTIFFSSHILNDVERLCDTIAVIHKGNILYTGKTAGFVGSADNLEKAFVSRIQQTKAEE